MYEHKCFFVGGLEQRGWGLGQVSKGLGGWGFEGGWGLEGAGDLGRAGAWGDGTDVCLFVHSLARTDGNSPLCSINHRPLRVRCPKRDQGRHTWRHNSVLSSIIGFIRPFLKDGFSLYSDLNGFQAPHGGVIPPDVLVTVLRPDLFLVDESAREVVLLELTCPWDRNINRSHDYKQERYASLVADLLRNYKVFHFVCRGVRARPNYEGQSGSCLLC